jgi:hypothetical protein
MTGVSLKTGARSSRSGSGYERSEAQDLADRLSPAMSESASVAGVIGPQGDRPAGLVLRVDPRDGEGAADFQVAVVDAGGRTLIALGPFAEDEVIATWRGLGAASGLELMVASLDGALQKPFPQVGRVQLGQIRIRRRNGLHGGRRPRFLVRRKTGRLPLRPEVHRGEREFGTLPRT